MVDHHQRRAAGPQDALELGDDALGVGDVVDDAVREDEVEARILERQLDRGRLHEILGREPLELESPPREAQRNRALVEAGVARAGAQELQPVRRDPAADLEHVAPGPVAEPHDLGDVRLERVAVPLDRREERGRADRLVGEAKARLGWPTKTARMRPGRSRRRAAFSALMRRSSLTRRRP